MMLQTTYHKSPQQTEYSLYHGLSIQGQPDVKEGGEESETFAMM